MQMTLRLMAWDGAWGDHDNGSVMLMEVLMTMVSSRMSFRVQKLGSNSGAASFQLPETLRVTSSLQEPLFSRF